MFKKNLQLSPTSIVGLIILIILSSSFSCNNNKKGATTPIHISPGSKAVIFIHGLMDNGGLNKVSDKLKQDFPGVQIIAFNRKKSRVKTISGQAADMFEELKKLSIDKKEIILIGDSQGGLVAWELYNSYKDQLQIKGLITNHTPWLGTPTANIPQQKIQKMNEVVIKIASHLPNLTTSADSEPSELVSRFLPDFTAGAGIEDLKPDSFYIQNVKKELPNAQIPILFLGGKVEDFAHCILPLISSTIINTLGLPTDSPKLNQIVTSFSTNDSVIKHVNKLQRKWNAIVKDPVNDLLIPLDSQLATGIDRPNFQRLVVKNYHHYVSMATNAVYPTIVNWINSNFTK